MKRDQGKGQKETKGIKEKKGSRQKKKTKEKRGETTEEFQSGFMCNLFKSNDWKSTVGSKNHFYGLCCSAPLALRVQKLEGREFPEGKNWLYTSSM